MSWISTTTGPLLNLDKVHYLDVEGSGSTWHVIAYMDTAVVNSGTDGTTTTLTYATYTTEAAAIAALGSLVASGSGKWLLVNGTLAAGGQLLNLDKVYQFVVGYASADNFWYLEACLDEGIASGSGNDGYSASVITSTGGDGYTYSTEADAVAALAVLLQQLAVVNG